MSGPGDWRGPAALAAIALLLGSGLAVIGGAPHEWSSVASPQARHSPRNAGIGVSPAEASLAAADRSLAAGNGPTLLATGNCLVAALHGADAFHCAAAALRAPAHHSTPAGWSYLGQPYLRYGTALAYDAADGYVLAFGGLTDPGSTWNYSNGVWTNLTSTVVGAPPPRAVATMSYDPALGEVVLFGGDGLAVNPVAAVLGDTWTYHAGTWTNVSRTAGPAAPPPRFEAALAYDANDSALVLFGGANTTSQGLGGTWEFLGAHWHDVSANQTVSPRGSQEPPMASDATDGNVVLFGDGSGSAPFQNQTWTFTGNRWANATAQVRGAPVGRGFAGFSEDSTDGGAVLFGGYGAAPVGSFVNTAFADTWHYASGVWTRLDSGGIAPSERLFMSMADDPSDSGIVLVGGADFQNGSFFGDTWSFASTAWTLRIALATPTPRLAPTMAYDSTTGEVVLFGGAGLNDTFAFTAGAWQALHPTRSPPGRLGATLADDPIDHELVLFGGERVVGGRAGVVALNDTWVWANGTWTQVASTSGGPPGRAQAGTAFDSIAGTVILFGGNGARSIFNDTWAFHAGRWTDVTNAHASPSPRWGLTLANDPADSGVLLFGGYCGTRPPGTYCDDTWTFSGSAWTNRSSTAAPPARYSAGMLENSASGQIVLFGGTGQICVTTANSTSCAAVMLNDTWVYSGGTWTNWTSTLGPAPQGGAGPTFVDDPTDGYEFLFDVPASGSYPGTGTWWSLAPISGAAGLAVSTPTATVNPVTVNATTQLSVTVTGGSPPYQIVWNGLPGGCTSQNATQMPCTPNATGTVSVAVTATDSHGTHGTGGSLAITVTASPTRKIGSVRIDPTTATVVTNASAVFTATAWDGSGQPLSGVSYDWSLSPGQFATLALVGVPSIVSGTSVSVVAGSSPGVVEVRVNATYSGTTLSAFANLTIKGVGTGTGTVHASTGAPLGFVAILAIAALIAVLAALGVWAWSRSRSRSPPPPSSEPPQP